MRVRVARMYVRKPDMLQILPQSNGRPFLLHARANVSPIQETGRILGKKWHLVLIQRLLEGKMGYNDLRAALGEVSAKILSQALHDLQSKGIVDRRVTKESPMRVEYSLTAKGEDLHKVLAELESWRGRWDVGTHATASPSPEQPA